MVRAALVAPVFVFVFACAAPDEPESQEGPGLEPNASAASLALVALCRHQGEQCAAYAANHPCQLANASCMTASECTAQTMTCIASALQS